LLTKPVKQSDLLDAILIAVSPGAEDGNSRDLDAGLVETERARLRILLAEDNPVNQLLATKLLQKQGYSVTVANDGREALTMLQEAAPDQFDLVLMDVQMPQMDGFEVTAAIRKKEKSNGRHLPIVAMTAHAMKGDRERCLESGMDDYLTKPVRAGQLYETMAAVVTRAREKGRPAALPAGFPAAIPDKGSVPREPPGALADPPPQAAGRPMSNGGRRALAVGLKAVDGDTELLLEIARAFLSETPRLLGDMEGAIARTDAPLLHRAAHTIKGGLRTFGADVAYELACRLEGLGRAGDVRAAGEPFGSLKQAVVELQQELSQFAAESAVSESVESSRSNP
jgi:CheY-like chemotaxis protein